MIKQFLQDDLLVKVFATRDEMGGAAAFYIAENISTLLLEKQEINMVFAAALSQNELYGHLILDKSVPWHKINAFHMDEYIGLPADAPQAFSNYLIKKLFDHCPFKTINLINPYAENPADECERYEALLEKFPPDIVCMGIGENGHIAFNDPPVADFHDKKLVKIVELENACRQQQVNDGAFSDLENVPAYAITLTIPALLNAAVISCVVPGPTKAKAVYNTINNAISTDCPATILRRTPTVVLFLDAESAARL